MIFFEIIEKARKKHGALILYSLLNRIPIIVNGEEQGKIDDLLIELSELVHFRKEFVFYTDFVSKEEYKQLVQNEESDFKIQRMIIRCPCNVSIKALNMFENFKSWIIGSAIKKTDYAHIKKGIKKKINTFLSIMMSLDGKITIDIEGIDIKTLNLTFERSILQKISEDTDDSIARMKRVLIDKIKLQHIDPELVDMLLDFKTEKLELKLNIFNKEIQNFFSGSKRAFFILSRLGLLKNLEINANIGSKTLLKTIDYEQNNKVNHIVAPIEKQLTFIKHEWGEDFGNLVENGKKLDFGNKIQSLWG